jgi:hypothetical protein
MGMHHASVGWEPTILKNAIITCRPSLELHI